MKKLILTIAMASVAIFGRAADLEAADMMIAGNGPTNITSVAETARAYAFAFNRTVETISLPDLKQPAAMMFNGCMSLRSVEMPSLSNGTETERALAGIFAGCQKLESVDLTGIEFATSHIQLPLGVPPTNRKVRFHFKDGIRDASGKVVSE